MIARREFLLRVPASLALCADAAGQEKLRVRQVDIVHHTHTDVGYTDLPSVCRDMQKRFIDVALDTCLDDKRFRWTVESMLGLDDWWRASSSGRRDELLRMIRSGQMDVMAMPFNQTPFHNAAQWTQMLAWAPENVWNMVRPRAAMQNDVNGIPRAGAMRLLDKGVGHLLMGINADSGGAPFQRPTAFWWKLPDGRKMFVWLGDHYGTAHSYFEPTNWIRSQPRGAQTEYRPPRSGDILRTDEASMRASHHHFIGRLKQLEEAGYKFERLILSFTNQWRYDNDPPFPPLADFVDAWDRLGLEPPLRLTTATQAVLAMEHEVGSHIPEYSGEWADWWANGDASGPRELAASRHAKRYLAAATSEVWGPMPVNAQPSIEAILKDLCLFDEHTWGANISIEQPYSLQTIGQYTEKSLLAYRPMGRAESLLGRRARTRLASAGESLYVVNTARHSFSGFVRFPAAALRGDFHSLEDKTSGRKLDLRISGDEAGFWVDGLAPVSILQLRLNATAVEDTPAAQKPLVPTDAAGWPLEAKWPGMSKPLFSGELANFLVTGVIPPANRGSIAEIHRTEDPAKREELRKRLLRQTAASYDATEAAETPHTLIYTQGIEHPRIEKAWRRLEVWKREPRARLTVRINRISSVDPEAFYLAFAVPVKNTMPVFSNGGVPFVPYHDQLPGTCRDYYAIDGWAHYETSAGHWIWVTRDAPLVAVGGPHTIARRTEPPADTHRVLAMIFDNFWHTNFVADSHGLMEFQFDLAWRNNPGNPAELAETLVSEPVVLINPSGRESLEMANRLFRP